MAKENDSVRKTARAILIIFVLILVGYGVIKEWVKQHLFLSIVILIVVIATTIVILYFYFKILAEARKEAEETTRKEREIRKSILAKERVWELKGLSKEEKEYKLSKWLEEEESKFKKEKVPRVPIHRKLKKAIFKAYGSRCAMCNSLEFLHIHHIDGNRANNNPRNLIALCTKCHYSRKFRKEQLQAKWRPPKY